MAVGNIVCKGLGPAGSVKYIIMRGFDSAIVVDDTPALYLPRRADGSDTLRRRGDGSDTLRGRPGGSDTLRRRKDEFR